MKIVFILSTLLLIGCNTNKGPWGYEMCVGVGGEHGSIIKNDIIGDSDTSLSIIKGYITDGYGDTLPFANVSLINQDSSYHTGISTSLDGSYKLYCPKGIYDLKYSYVGYQGMEIIELKLNGDKLMEVDVSMGKGTAYITYLLKSDKRLSRRQLREKEEEKFKENYKP